MNTRLNKKARKKTSRQRERRVDEEMERWMERQDTIIHNRDSSLSFLVSMTSNTPTVMNFKVTKYVHFPYLGILTSLSSLKLISSRPPETTTRCGM